MSEQQRERPERERSDEADAVRVEASPVRCPFCHEGVRIEEPDWVACAHCLARHHDACWGEAGRCGACGAGERLARTTSPSASASSAAVTLPPPEPDAPPSLAARLFGGPRRFAFSRAIPGDVGPEVMDLDEAVVGAARARLDEMGRFERLGRTLTWTTVGSRHAVQQIVTVTVAPRDGHMLVEVREDLGHLAGGLYGGLGGGLGGGGLGALIPAVLALTRSPATVVVASLAWLLVVFALARALFARHARRRREALRELTDTIAREVAARVRPPRRDPKKAGDA